MYSSKLFNRITIVYHDSSFIRLPLRLVTTTSGTTVSGSTTITTLFGTSSFYSIDRVRGFSVIVPKEEVFVD